MKRKEFLLATMAAMPLLVFGRLRTEAPGAGKPFVVRSGGSRTGEQMKYRGTHPNNVLVSGKDTGGALSVFAYRGLAKVGPSLHVHFSQDEIMHVVEGRYRFVAGEETLELGVGDTVFLPRNIPHSWIQLTDRGGMVYMAQPAGTLEEFFREMGGLRKPPTEEESQRIHLSHGMRVVGPPLSLD